MSEQMMEIVDPMGRVSYRRPEGDPLLDECRDLILNGSAIGYTIRPVPPPWETPSMREHASYGAAFGMSHPDYSDCGVPECSRCGRGPKARPASEPDVKDATEVHAKILDCYDEHPASCVCGAEALLKALRARGRR